MNWHQEFQSYFEKTEINFPMITGGYSNRRADTVVDDFIIEFQHSHITVYEVNQRNHDYALHGYKVYWVIDGNIPSSDDGISDNLSDNPKDSVTDNLSDFHGDQYIDQDFATENQGISSEDAIESAMEFIAIDDEFTEEEFPLPSVKEIDDYYQITLDNPWKYKAFIDCNIIFVNIGDKLYYVNPKLITNGVFNTKYCVDKEDFIRNTSKIMEKLREYKEDFQCELVIKQQGAGNGKTYDLINQFRSFNCEQFVIVTKQHSAKHQLVSEYKNQGNEGIVVDGRRYFVDDDKLVVFSTIDSMIYALSSSKSSSIDLFRELSNAILNDECKSSYKVAGKQINLNNKLCIICDETQDLPEYYAYVFLTLMKRFHVNLYLVGDLLQSISYEDNAFKFMMDLPDCNDLSSFIINEDRQYMYDMLSQYNHMQLIKRLPVTKSNICRRFNHPKLIKFVNHVIPFDNYGLPSIEPHEVKYNNYEPLNIFVRSSTNKEIDSRFNINDLRNIMDRYIDEVKNNDYKPNDFLIVVPYCNNNILAHDLEGMINNYWSNRLGVDGKYAYFHVSSDNQAINLSESDNATRIVSIHSSKGDGRPVVFVLDLSDRILDKYKHSFNNLVCDSLLHVALTRMKKKLYIMLNNNFDNCFLKMHSFITHKLPAIPNFSVNLNITKMVDKMNINDFNKFADMFDLENFKDTNDKRSLIDFKHHCFRYNVMKMYLLLITMKEPDKFQVMYKKTGKSDVDVYEYADHIKFFKERSAIKNNQLKGINSLKIVILNRPNDNGINDVIIKTIDKVQVHFFDIINNDFQVNLIEKICPYQAFVLSYLISSVEDVYQTNITMNTLFYITKLYFSHGEHLQDPLHDKCDCRGFYDDLPNNSKYISEDIRKLINFHDSIKIYIAKVNDFIKSHDYIYTYDYMTNIFHEKSIKFTFDLKLIGYGADTTHIISIVPQLSMFNYYKIRIKGIIDSFIGADGYKIKESSALSKYFKHKQISQVIFTCSDEEFHYNLPELYPQQKEFILDLIHKFAVNEYVSSIENILKYMEILSNEEIFKLRDDDKYQLFFRILDSLIDKYAKHKGNNPGIVVEIIRNNRDTFIEITKKLVKNEINSIIDNINL